MRKDVVVMVETLKMTERYWAEVTKVQTEVYYNFVMRNQINIGTISAESRKIEECINSSSCASQSLS